MLPCPSPCFAIMAEEHRREVLGSGDVAKTWTGVTIKALLCWMPFGTAACLGECSVVLNLD